jgi:hypothetical protein
LPVKDRVLLEENIVEQMSSSAEAPKDVLQPIDSLTYNTFVTSFNQEYSSVLSEGQKKLLTTYITSFEDNEVELKVYLNEEIGRIKGELADVIDNTEDVTFKEKVEKIYGILEDTKERQIDTQTVELVLQTQQLLEEMEK